MVAQTHIAMVRYPMPLGGAWDCHRAKPETLVGYCAVLLLLLRTTLTYLHAILIHFLFNGMASQTDVVFIQSVGMHISLGPFPANTERFQGVGAFVVSFVPAECPVWGGYVGHIRKNPEKLRICPMLAGNGCPREISTHHLRA